jgi:hypothetical protein
MESMVIAMVFFVSIASVNVALGEKKNKQDYSIESS